ncbi:MAG: hypothetical protein ACSHYF_12610 [Verrucomicrobiaceae bacterium]
MVGQSQEPESVIHFVCQHCQTSLTVGASLAGITGPCPSCGRDISAPVPTAPQSIEVKPREVKAREAAPSETLQADAQITTPDHSGEKIQDQARRRRAVSPNTGLSEAHQEKMEVAAVVKMLLAGLVVLAVVLAVAYWLQSQFAS